MDRDTWRRLNFMGSLLPNKCLILLLLICTFGMVTSIQEFNLSSAEHRDILKWLTESSLCGKYETLCKKSYGSQYCCGSSTDYTCCLNEDTCCPSYTRCCGQYCCQYGHECRIDGCYGTKRTINYGNFAIGLGISALLGICGCVAKSGSSDREQNPQMSSGARPAEPQEENDEVAV
ncbi:uncharacterized protein LOC118432921 [Folsomia candida]|uniref:uncharacterized protein LOC118432921 n=1 Tax=Folsomia candida TaxID=158441 RepID=UPI000B8F8C45|nr:uncharacterized protein LOC118432921 [Folsomia candida]